MIADRTAYVAMGANLGDRARNLLDGVRWLLDLVPARARLSKLYDTAPVGNVDQPRFLNAVIEMTGRLPEPEALLGICLDIEARLGRVRAAPLGPRTLDLDLLLWDDHVLQTPALTLPHPRMHERRFVLAPLAELAPDRLHPVLGVTIAELLRRAPL
jgi:2-amino-4-hydroxy-6-hydroxymethyldihydropteridine diphosphokinase